MARFPETSCSQCGATFGPGNNGFSHCHQHEYAAADTKALKSIRLRTIKLHRQALDADLILSAFNIERAINKIDAELARRGEYFNAALLKAVPDQLRTTDGEPAGLTSEQSK